MLVIDGQEYNIPVLEIKRKAEVLDRYAQRTENGELQRKIIGVYFNYSLSLGSTADTAEYARLWDKLTEPAEFHTVTVPDETGDYTFTAYFSNVGDELRYSGKGKNYFTGLTVNFIAKSPARK